MRNLLIHILKIARMLNNIQRDNLDIVKLILTLGHLGKHGLQANPIVTLRKTSLHENTAQHFSDKLLYGTGGDAGVSLR